MERERPLCRVALYKLILVDLGPYIHLGLFIINTSSSRSLEIVDEIGSQLQDFF